MKYFCKINNGIIEDYTEDSLTAQIGGFVNEIDYEPIYFNNNLYTKEKFNELKNTTEYKNQIDLENQANFEEQAKNIENQACYIEYKNKKISLDEILFKSTIYSSLTDTVVYLKAEDGSLLKVSRTIFLLIVAKAKSNLKDTEEALYNASYDKTKSLEDNINSIKNIFNSINKIFND